MHTTIITPGTKVYLTWEPIERAPDGLSWTGGWWTEVVAGDGAVLHSSRHGYPLAAAIMVQSLRDAYPGAEIIVRAPQDA
jgi:hypothetical protein